MAYHSKSLQFLSILQIVVGSVSLLLGIASAFLATDFMSHVGFGIWFGVWIIIAGILGFLGSRNRRVPSQCLLGTFMGFTITTCVFAGAMLICYSIALDSLTDKLKCYNRYMREWNEHRSFGYYYSYKYGYCKHESGSTITAGIGIDSVLLIVSILEFAVGLASSIFCCAAICPCWTGTCRVQAAQQVVYLHHGMGQASTADGGMVVMSGVPSGTVKVVQPPARQFIVQQSGQPTLVPVSLPGTIQVQQSVAGQTNPTPVLVGAVAGGQTAQTQPQKREDAPPAYT